MVSTGIGGVLDDAGVVRRYDASGMLASIATLPDQLLDGWERTRGLALPERYREVRSVALVGMGGSAIAGDLARGIFSDRLRLGLQTVRDYELPAWAGPETLVIASSHSGATEETVSALATALERRCPVAVITTGGPLGDVARRVELPLLMFPGGGQPRAAVGYSLVLLAGLLERVGALDLDANEVRGAAEAAGAVFATSGPDVPTERNTAKQLAWTLVDRLPVVEASGFLVPVARRWKAQLNENAKSMAVAEELPEATHNTVVGYSQPETLRDHLYVIFLASPSDHPRNSLRASLSAELLGAEQIAHQFVPVPGNGRFAQAVSAVVLGDLVSTYLAVLYGLDPTPVDALVRIKARLATADDDGDD